MQWKKKEKEREKEGSLRESPRYWNIRETGRATENFRCVV